MGWGIRKNGQIRSRVRCVSYCFAIFILIGWWPTAILLRRARNEGFSRSASSTLCHPLTHSPLLVRIERDRVRTIFTVFTAAAVDECHRVTIVYVLPVRTVSSNGNNQCANCDNNRPALTRANTEITMTGTCFSKMR